MSLRAIAKQSRIICISFFDFYLDRHIRFTHSRWPENRGAGSRCEPEGFSKAASSLRVIAKQCPQSGCFAIQEIIYSFFDFYLDLYNKKRRKIRFLFFFKTTFLFYVSDNSLNLQRSDQVCSYFSHLRSPSQTQYQAALK